jgi:hypothetical protein
MGESHRIYLGRNVGGGDAEVGVKRRGAEEQRSRGKGSRGKGKKCCVSMISGKASDR